MAKRSHNVFGDGSRTSSIRRLIPTKWPARITNIAYNKYQVQAIHQLFIGNRMHSYPNSYYSRCTPIQIQRTIDLPIHEAQSNPLIVSNKDGSTNDQVPKATLKEKAKKEAAKEKEDVAAKQQKEAEIQENIRILAQQLHYVFGDRPHTYTPRKRLCDMFGYPSCFI
ncbi:hypothetical protein R3W88_006154 [Solanum pinnatisectum]|uniref:Uncharacterized protein n=1 Tax=Solanum pinnatisectum TaxID=50273 RepID=A0AAV9KDY2_9SOLN|nr:hypothetical protein R3W88_006154 [Solanum pinnatisectum]